MPGREPDYLPEGNASLCLPFYSHPEVGALMFFDFDRPSYFTNGVTTLFLSASGFM